MRRYGWPPPRVTLDPNGLKIGRVVIYDDQNQVLGDYPITPVLQLPLGSTLQFTLTYSGHGLSATP